MNGLSQQPLLAAFVMALVPGGAWASPLGDVCRASGQATEAQCRCSEQQADRILNAADQDLAYRLIQKEEAARAEVAAMSDKGAAFFARVEAWGAAVGAECQ